MNWSNLLLMRLAETFLFSTVFLIVALCLRGACRRPALRMALAWGTLLGLLILALAPWISVRPQARVTTWLTQTAPVVPAKTATEPVRVELGRDPAVAAPLPVHRRGPHRLEPKLIRIPLGVSPEPSPPQSPMSDSIGPFARPSDPEPPTAGWSARVAVAWLAGSSLLMTWMLVGRLRACRLLRRSQAAPAWVEGELDQLVTAGRRPGLRITSDISAAAVIGTFTPRILLPTTSVQDESAQRPIVRAALAHEWAHIRHGDLWLLALERLLLPVYFIHPLYWLLRKLVRADQELLADAAAAGEAPEEYAAALVEWAKSAARPPVPAGIAALSMWDVRTPLTRRVEMLLNSATEPQPVSRRRKLAVMGGVLIAGLALSLCTLQAPAGQPPKAAEGAANPQSAEGATPAPATPPPVTAAIRGPSVEERLLELDVRDAEVELEKADLALKSMVDANQKVRGTFPDIELEKARYPVSKAKIAVERAKLKLEGYRQEHPQRAVVATPAEPASDTVTRGRRNTARIPIPHVGPDSHPAGRSGSANTEEPDLGLTGPTESPAGFDDILPQSDRDFLRRMHREMTGTDATLEMLGRYVSATPAQFEAMLNELMRNTEHQNYWKRIAAERGLIALHLRGTWVRRSTSKINYWQINGPMLISVSGNGHRGRFLIQVRDANKPAAIDFEDFNNPGHISRGIFKLEGMTLTVCLASPDAPRPADFKSNSAGGFPLLLVYDRETRSTVDVQGGVESITAGTITLTGNRQYPISASTEFIRITTTREVPIAAGDVTDEDQVRFEQSIPFTGAIARIEVVRPPPVAIDPNSVEGMIYKALDAKMSMNMKEKPWPEALRTALERTKVPLLLDEKALAEAEIDMQALVTLRVDSSLRNVLRLLLEPQGLTFVVEESKLKVVVAPGGDLRTRKAATEARKERFKALAGALVTIRADVKGAPGKWIGRGAIIDPRGYVITAGALPADRLANLLVEQGGKEYRVTVVIADPGRTLTLLKMDAQDLPSVKLSSRDPILFDMVYGPVPDASGELVGNRILAVNCDLTIDETTIDQMMILELPQQPQSTGPLLDDTGNLVGLVTHLPANMRNLVYATPVTKIGRFISEHIPPAPANR